jgi:DNA-binding LytR/AlgR family response regulator
LDDELPGLAYLKMLCDQFEEVEVVKSFNSPKALLKELPGLEFDFCILDIEMPEMNGLQLAALLKGKPVIFTTAYKEYAADAFDLDAVDYVRKPVQRDRLHHAIQKVVALQNKQQAERDFVQLNTDKGKALIYFNQLLYCTVSHTDSRDKIAFLSDGSQLTLKNISFESLIEMMPPGHFCRLNKKDMITQRAVQTFAYNEVTTNIPTTPGQFLKLPLGERYRKDFLRYIQTP